ncbi:endolytic transglycosylase MltG [Paenibacillus polymyxa]|uniref:endolytic transglycosylase MltG n=1 Tax=Paenibacillus TaxID=44249 RepID=UPI0002EA5228|nr:MULTISPECIES: endolytic transglycosylase MltG [Paenibacillus]KAF6659683.1 endolytic transglycosylase MltG [Paenibacillus sp. EKM301P]KKD54981.1 aminodeoxychorismate lyase [Paenibacillus sp. ICGEB2008]RPE02089.1 endolytic transglycosylase MltG [Paenibacillus polymyxa]UBS89723.1 endolytic transglycosylase MltG [Paenibacillus polymyxa]WHX38386.1 endolytic transglycosylase MltG [Paenibacillus polymyxa]
MLTLLLLLVCIAGGALLYIWNAMQPVQPKTQPVAFTVVRGTGTSAIADTLEQKGLIRNALVFKAYVKFKQQGNAFQAGKYEAQPGATFDQLIAKLSAGDVVKEEMIRFTIPEGFTIRQMADKLQKEGLADRQQFLQLANDPSAFDVALVRDIPKQMGLRYALEGYLFPETYELKKGSTTKDIIQTMLEQTQKRLDTISDLDAGLQQRGETLHQLLTVASLVEREVVVDDERPIVAGVIYNRLQQDKKLEIDATVQYMLDKQKERLYYKDLAVESPYNTYMHQGLPPGPIASPSLKSVVAALQPKSTDYLFYVTKKDGTHKHLFAKTYKEHLHNIQISNRKTN